MISEGLGIPIHRSPPFGVNADPATGIHGRRSNSFVHGNFPIVHKNAGAGKFFVFIAGRGSSAAVARERRSAEL
jgi:hypothetical protein